MGTISLKNKRVLVTGGLGYLGSNLLQALKLEQVDFFVLSRSAHGLSNYFGVDLTNRNAVQKVIEEVKPDIIYHFAAKISRARDFDHYEEMVNVNVIGTLNVLRAIQQLRCHFIFTSSSEIYGNNKSPFHEKMIPQPVSPYSLTKMQAEVLIETFCKFHQIPYTILRIFNFYGPNMPEDFFIPQIIAVLERNEDFIMTKGEQTRDFLYIDDVVAALLLAAKESNALNETFNVCSGLAVKLNELATEISSHINSSGKVLFGGIPYRENEVWEMLGDPSKIKEKLGFEPQINIENGVKKMI
jgi:UDP-glucose 4-epimerase